MSGLESRDDGVPPGMLTDPDRYYGAAWERSKAQAVADRPLPATRPAAAAGTPATLIPGVVEMSLRGYSDREVEVTVAALRAAGFRVWRSNSSGTRSGNAAGYRYYTVEVPKASDG